MKDKIIIFGFDGVTFDLIRPWVKEGRLPNFARLMEEGSYGELRSSPDMASPSAWTSFATGKKPCGHGIFNFMDLVPGTFNIHYLNSTHRDGETIWSLLSKAGKKVGVLGVPMTYPSDKLDGFMIAGWNTPNTDSKGFTYPDDLADTIKKRFGDYILFPTVKKNIIKGKPEKAIEELHKELEQKHSITKYLMDNNEWDVLITVFIATDQVQHYFWHCMDERHPKYNDKESGKYRNAIFDIYKKCDDIIHDITSDLDDDSTVIIMSDHGNGLNAGGKQFLVPWLVNLGMLHDYKFSPPSLSGAPLLWLKSKMKMALKVQYDWLNTYLSVKAKNFLNALLPALRDKVESSWRLSAVDWNRTKVYFHYYPRVNLKGREPHGIVLPGKEYEEVRDFIIDRLYEARDIKTGEKIVEKVYKKEEMFHGKYFDGAPDIIIQWREAVISGIVCTDGQGRELITVEKDETDLRSGNHTPYGIFIARGKHIKKGEEVSGLDITDIAPTVLHLMGQKIPEEMDGKVAKGILKDDFLKSNPVKTEGMESKDNFSDERSNYTKEEEGKVRQTLSDLGYID